MTATTEKHPRGLYVLFGTEMWERFSFYTVNGMLVLYVTNAVQGFGWSNAQAAVVSSYYQGFVYFTPLFGGLIADLFIGNRRSIMIGGVFFMAGHALLAVPNSVSIFYAALTCLVVGNGLFKPNVSAMVGNLYPEGSHLKDKAYLIFYMGINTGAALAPIVAEFMRNRFGFHPAFFMGAIGMALSLIIFGANQKYVRHADRRRRDFKKADPEAVAVTEDLPPSVREAAALIEAVPAWKRVSALIVVFLIVIIFWMIFHQNSITLTLWANDHTAWNVTGILSNAINPLWVITLSLPLVGFWSWLDRKNLEPSTPTKMMIGMLLTGLSMVVLYFGAARNGFTRPAARVVRVEQNQIWITISAEARKYLGITAPGTEIEVLSERDKKMVKVQAWPATLTTGGQVQENSFVKLERWDGARIEVSPTQEASPWWLILAYGVLTLGELMLSPMGLSLVSKVAPQQFRGLMMGGWFTATAIGNKLTSIGGFWDLWSHTQFFITLAIMAFAMAVLLFLLLRPLKKAMPGV